MSTVRRTVTGEVRRVVARLGGTPRTHRTALPTATVLQLPEHDHRAVHRSSLEIDVGMLAAETIGADVTALVASRPKARVSRLHRPLEATAHVGDVLHVSAVPHDPRLLKGSKEAAVLRYLITAPDSSTAHYEVAEPAAGAVDALSTEHRKVPVLPHRAPVHRFRVLPEAVFTSTRSRIPASQIAPERLAAGWKTLLREHPEYGAALTFVGVYGPFALGTLTSAGLDARGRLVVGLRPHAVPGPLGDVIVAMHESSGRVFRTAYPRDIGPRRRLR